MCLCMKILSFLFGQSVSQPIELQTCLAGVKMLWPLGNVGTGPDCNTNCKFSRHVNGNLHRTESNTGGCGTCTSLNFDVKSSGQSQSVAYLRRLPANVFNGMVNLTSVDFGANAIVDLPEDLFDNLPVLKLVDMPSTIHRELGTDPMACRPVMKNSSASLHVEINLNPVNLNTVGLNLVESWGGLMVCPPGCSGGTFFHQGVSESECKNCDAGSYAGGGGAGACALCSPGKYASNYGARMCSECPRNSTSSAGSTDIFVDCKCRQTFERSTTVGTAFECVPVSTPIVDTTLNNESPLVSEPVLATVEDEREDKGSNRVLIVACTTIVCLLIATCLVAIFLYKYPLRKLFEKHEDDVSRVVPQADGNAMHGAANAQQSGVLEDEDEVLDLTPERHVLRVSEDPVAMLEGEIQDS